MDGRIGRDTDAQERVSPGTLGLSLHARVLLWRISRRNVPRRNPTGFKFLRVFFSAPRAEGGAGTLRSGPRVGALRGRVATCCDRVGCGCNELRPSRKVDHLMYLCCLLGGGTVAQERDPPGTLGLSPHARVFLWRISRRNVPRRNSTGFKFLRVFFSAPRAEGGAGTSRSGPRVGALHGRVATRCDRVGCGRNELRPSRLCGDFSRLGGSRSCTTGRLRCVPTSV